MMTQGNPSLHVSGAKMTPDIQMDVNATNAVQYLKQELISSQTENKKLTDQLNCLVSLIKRSWNGDRHATIHLSNIVGMELPQQYAVHDGSIARPNSQLYSTPSSKTRCERNWERLAMRLLDREYRAVEEEIREYQQRYIENRQAYMDAVLQDHQQSMSRIPLHRKTDPAQAVEDVDTRFIRHNKSLQRMGSSFGKHYRRVQSAGVRRRPSLTETVEKADVSLRDLVGETPSSEHFIAGQTLSEPHSITPSIYGKRRPLTAAMHHHHPPPNTYNDPGRYTQNNLFQPSETDRIKRSRPISASSLREGDIIRSRPRSGHNMTATQGDKPAEKPVFLTQKHERPLKYETTRPVSSKTKSLKQRRNSTGSAMKKSADGQRKTLRAQTDVIHATNKPMTMTGAVTEGNNADHAVDPEENAQNGIKMGDKSHEYDQRGDEHETSDDHDDDFALSSKPPVAVRVKSAFTRRPAFIDEFANEEKAMKLMEEDFKKTALSLQKKLGIGESGLVTYD